MTRFSRGSAALLVMGAALMITGLASATWVSAQKIDTMGGNHADVNTPALDGCPIQSPDGLSLYMASNRPGGKGGLDIWMASRASVSAPWGAPQNLGEPVNSAADDFCPTPVGKNGLFFVSREALPGACGQGDIYFTHRNASGTLGGARAASLHARPGRTRSWTNKARRGSPSAASSVEEALYFSRSSVAPSVAGEIFVSERQNGARFGPASAVAELNDATANDIQPNVRADGLEVVFTSNRPGTARRYGHLGGDALGLDASWSAPVNLGAVVNTGAGRDEAVALARREAASLRARTRSRGQQRHLHDDAAVGRRT